MRTEIVDVNPPIVSKYHNVLGLSDLLPDSLRYWHHTEQVLAKIANSFGFRNIVLPPLDPASAYRDAFGAASLDFAVSAQLGEAVDEEYVLRAHPRLGLLRSYAENGMSLWPPPVRIYYQSDVIKKTATGLHQDRYFCLDCLGAKDATTSASMIALLRKLDQELHTKKSQIIVNSNGCSECRPAYEQQFAAYAHDRQSELCPNCCTKPTFDAMALCEVDSNSSIFSEAPSFLDYLCPNCHSQLAGILEACDELDIAYEIDARLHSTDPEAEQTIFAMRVGTELHPAIIGYHFNRIATKINGDPLNALGITIDMHRLSQYLESLHATLPDENHVQIFIAQLGAQAKTRCVPLLQQLYSAGYYAVTASESESITQQLQVAANLNARITLIMGQKEAMNGHVIMRDMASGLQDDVFLDELLPALEERLAVEV